MIRLATINGERVKPKLVLEDVEWQNPQRMLDLLCIMCFRYRKEYLKNVYSYEPFDLARAEYIMNVMLDKGKTDLKAHSLGNSIRKNWYRFKDLE